MRLQYRNSLKKLFYVEVQLDLTELLIVGREFAQKQPENGLTAWVISRKRYKKAFFMIDIVEYKKKFLKSLVKIDQYYLKNILRIV